MGKLGKKARKFARKNLQSVMKRKRKLKSMFKKKNNSRRLCCLGLRSRCSCVHENWLASHHISKLKDLAARKKLDDLTVKPVPILVFPGPFNIKGLCMAALLSQGILPQL